MPKSFCSFDSSTLPIGGVSMWRHSPVRVAIQSRPNNFSAVEFSDVIHECCLRWVKVCGVAFLLAEHGQHANANIVITSKRLDGSGRVLADMQLPPFQDGDTSRQQRVMRIDTSEDWARYKGDLRRQQDIIRVVTHELGHGIGIGHNETSQPSLMSPYVGIYREPHSWDIREARDRYGKDKPEPDPPKPRPGKDDFAAFFEFSRASGHKAVDAYFDDLQKRLK